MSVIGFDIGNENCVVAAAKRGGIDVLLNDEAKRETQGVVSFGDKQRFLGSAGAAFATANPKSTISQIKRLIGRQYKEPSVQEDLKFLPFLTKEGPRGGILIELEYMKKKMTFTPVEILGMLFAHFKQIAEKNLESAVVDCVIGIPSYFTDLQRREYLNAATIAGLKPLTLMHDGTAIALGYGMYKTDLDDAEPIVVVFVDIGHSDTQVTVAEFEQGGMKILAHSFDPNLGGRDFDEVLFRHFAAQFGKEYNIDVYSNARACIRLRASCEKLKKVLSANTEAPLSIECLIEDKDVRGIITREEFENLSQQLLGRVTIPCLKAIEDSRISVDKIYTVELVGSGSRIPAITKMLTSLFGKEPTRTLNASECVARGCALRCAMLSPTLQVRDYEIQDVFPYSIVFPADEGGDKPPREFTFFSKGSHFPSYYELKYKGQTPLHIDVFYANKTDLPAGLSSKVGHFELRFSQSSSIIVTAALKFQLNTNGIFELKSVQDQSFGGQNPTHIPKLICTRNLDVASTKEEFSEAQEREKMLAEQDRKVEQLKDQRNTLESFVYDTRSKLSSAYKSFATDIEKDKIAKSLQETEDWLYEDSDDESDEHNYTGKLDNLKKLLGPVEKRFQDEKARANATKELLTLIAKYRSATDSMPPRPKHEVNNFCDEAEKRLSDCQQKEFYKKMNPRQWSYIIKHNTCSLKRNCESVLFKHSSPKFDGPLDSERRNNPVVPDQKDHPVNSVQRNHFVESDQKSRPINSDHKDHLVVDSNRVDRPMNSNQNIDGHTNLNQMGGHTYTDDWPPLVSSHGARPIGSNHGSPKQWDPPMGVNHSAPYMDSDQKDHPVNSAQRNHSVESDQKSHPVNSDQKDHLVNSNRVDRPMNSNRNNEGPMNQNQMEGHTNLNHMGGHVYTYDWSPLVSSHGDGPISSNHGSPKQWDPPMGVNHSAPYMGWNLCNRPMVGTNHSATQMGWTWNLPMYFSNMNLRDQPAGQNQTNLHVDSNNQGNRPSRSSQMEQPMNSYKYQKDQ